MPKNLVILKIKDGGSGHLENRKIAISLLWIDQFFLKIGILMFLIPPNRVSI